MQDQFGLLTSPLFDKFVFDGNSQSAGASWYEWTRPMGKSCISMFLLGGGGGGGTGVVGANSTAAGGGGGGSGGMTIIEIPLDLLPPRLYISVGQAKTGAGIASYVSTQPNTTANHVVAKANGGGAGGNGSGATAGSAGTAAGIATVATMPLGWAWSKLALAGQAGTAGGTTGNSTGINYPTTGLRVTGGGGGGGLGASGANGSLGGSIIAVASPSYFSAVNGGTAPTSGTTPPTNGEHGTALPEAGFYFRGGAGAPSTHGTATGAGLVQAAGGNGGIGSGGGGMGGALTGSTAASLSYGGSGIVIFWCY